MDGTVLQTHTSAFTHVVMFLLIVVGGTLIMLELTRASRTHLDAQDVSQPIPEMARWQTTPN